MIFRPLTNPSWGRLSSSTSQFDVVVVGAGPGGYVCAIKAAQLGLKTALVESRGKLGGTCLNVGCMPSKVLLHATEYLKKEAHCKAMGISISPTCDLSKLMEYKDKTVSGFNRGIEALCKKYGVQVFSGEGSFSGDSLVVNSEQLIAKKGYVIATGSKPIRIFQGNESEIVTSDEAISFTDAPKKLLVVGGGVIGIELGSVWSRLGSNVTILESSPSGVLSSADSSVSQAITKSIREQGMTVETGVRLSSVSGRTAKSEDGRTFEFDKLLQCVGRSPNTAALQLASTNVKLDSRGQIQVDEKCRTADPKIFAVGDVCNSGPMLAHKAEEQGIAVAEMLAGHSDAYFPPTHHVPCAVYTDPEVAWIGLTEAQASEKFPQDIKTAMFPFMANSRSKALSNFKNSFVKIVARKDGTLLGVHAVGPYVSEVIGSAAIAMKYGASDKDLASVCTSHPTYSEALKEAAMMSAYGKPIHA